MIESVLVLRCVPPRQPRRSKTKPTTPLSLSLSLFLRILGARPSDYTYTSTRVQNPVCCQALNMFSRQRLATLLVSSQPPLLSV